MSRTALLLLATMLCAACSRPDNAAGTGGISAGEARALDDAAEMVESQQLPAAAMPAPQSPAAPQRREPTQSPATPPAEPAG